jgi:hypothetical protein
VTLPNLSALESEWAQFTLDKTGPRAQWTQDQRWRADNPGAYQQLLAYRAGTGPRPVLPPGTGARMVFQVDAYLIANENVVPPTVELPRPPFTVRDGGGTVLAFPAVFPVTTQAVTIKGQHVKNVTGYGIGSRQPWPPQVPTPGRTTVEDCIVENVGQGGAMGGKGEAGFWFSNPTDADRILARNCAWMGIFLGGTSHGSVLKNATVEDAPVGAYIEHLCYDADITVHTSQIADRKVTGGNEPGGVLAARSITQEWWYRNPDFGGRLVGPYNNTVRGRVYCPANTGNPNTNPRCGSYEGAGVGGTKYLGVTFYGPGPAVIAANRRGQGLPAPVFEDCVFENAGARVLFHDLSFGT